MDKEKLKKANSLKNEMELSEANISKINMMFKDKICLYKDGQLVSIPQELKNGILHLVRDYYENKLSKLNEEFNAL